MEQFGRAQSKIPQRIGTLEVRLVSHDPGGSHAADPPEGRARVEIYYTNGAMDEITVNLANHLSSNQLQGLLNLLDYLRNKAVSEILPSA